MSNENYEKKGYLLEDFRLFHLQGAQGVKAEYHYHEFCKLLLLVSGTGGYSVEGRRYALQPGDIVLVGSRAVHRPEFDPNAPYERIIVYIDPEFLLRHSSPDCNSASSLWLEAMMECILCQRLNHQLHDDLVHAHGGANCG